MAEVEWPEEVLDQLDRIAAYIALFDVAAAARMAERLFATGSSLAEFPRRGRPGPRGTREIVTCPPYVIRYRVLGNVVTILSIRHGAQYLE